LNHKFYKAFQHQDSESHKVQALECLGQLFIIPRETAEPTSLAKAAFYDPPFRQEYKALFCLGQLNHFELYVMGLGILRRLGPRIALINVSEFNRVPSDLMDLFR
jgi:hypothetical protein